MALFKTATIGEVVRLIYLLLIQGYSCMFNIARSHKTCERARYEWWSVYVVWRLINAPAHFWTFSHNAPLWCRPATLYIDIFDFFGYFMCMNGLFLCICVCLPACFILPWGTWSILNWIEAKLKLKQIPLTPFTS